MTIREFPFTKGIVSIEKHDSFYEVKQNELVLGKLNDGEPFQINDEGKTLTIIGTSEAIKSQTYYSGYKREIEISSDNPEASIYKKHGILMDASHSLT